MNCSSLLSRRLWLLTLLLPGVALAEARSETIAVLGVDSIEAPESAATTLVDALRDHLQGAPGITLAAKRDFMEIKMLYGCTDPSSLVSCLALVGRTMKADKVVYGTITGRGGRKTVQVVIKVAEVATEKLVGSIEEEVALAEVPQQARRWLGRLLPQLRQEAQIAIESTPGDAEIEIDGRSAGRTPMRITVAPGNVYTVLVGKDGHSPQSRKVTARAGETVQLELQLIPLIATLPAAAPAPGTDVAPGSGDQSRDHPGRNGKIAGVALLAVAALGAGIAIYTWRHYVDLEGSARSTLGEVQLANRGYSDAQAAWFARPSCTFPDGKPAGGPTDQYRNQCEEGRTYASATSGLWVGVGVIAAAAIGSIGYGVYKDRAGSTERAKSAFAPRLRLLSPVISQSGGGVSAAFEF